MTRSWDIAGVEAKLQRAKENIVNLNAEIGAFLGPDREHVVTNDNHDAVQKFVDERLSRAVPVRFSVLAAECIHNMRSSLDQLAWQLVLANGGRPGKKTHFPLFIEDPAGIEDGKRQKAALAIYAGAVKGMSDTAKAYILALQPYLPNNGGLDHDLRIIHDLNVTDKHHQLVVVQNAVQTKTVANFGLIQPTVGLNTFSVDTTELGTVLRSGSRTFLPVNVDTKIVIQVAFAQLGSVPFIPVTDGLSTLLVTVQRVNRELAGEFSGLP